MWRSPEPRYDAASAIAQGGRSYQEDAIVTDFPFGMDSGVAVLADGMGGHAAGDVASKIVVTEVYSELKFQSANFAEFESEIPSYMKAAAEGANQVMREHVEDHPETHGMGATLVSLVLVEHRMYWMSIGDSPLYLLRDGKLQQLNEDHSLAPQIDFMVEQGLISREDAQNHPDRNCLTSVILGGRVARQDCPSRPFELKMGDIVVVSSDGLQYLDNAKIQKLLYKYRRKKAAEIAGYLLEALDDLGDPEQDNISFSVIKLNHMKPVERKIVAKPTGLVEADRMLTTRVAVLPDGPKGPDPKEETPAEPVVAASDGQVPGPGEHLETYSYRGQSYTRVVPDKTAETTEDTSEAEADAIDPGLTATETTIPPGAVSLDTVEDDAKADGAAASDEDDDDDEGDRKIAVGA
ncbi:PP2C family protein-serine/threonine phosphatase [Jannaschia pohangensis]|uniref:Serine/threonine protein phosphatase PrpC n=1 Tax=Jannaschia pohangensis TaxID=390807 RepID=A0A1I3V0D8_9RHOB|nr:protein phosphatase 2C domain-containing protein [Jannaschia pohangensis]SFJ89124.1 Serine/threonine protein phosphatase PrpC [Jannaschia pohangensis]